MEDRWVRSWIREAVAQLPGEHAAVTYDVDGVPVTISGAHRAIVVIPAAEGARRRNGGASDTKSMGRE